MAIGWGTGLSVISLCDIVKFGRVDLSEAANYADLRISPGVLGSPTPPMASIDEDLGSIERDIRTLKIEYEQYFGGGRSRPPTDTQWRLEVMLKKYSDRAAEFTSGQRFRYSNLTQTYAKYHDMWRKKLAQKETGTSPHHYGAAAKAIEAERARKAAAAKPPEQPQAPAQSAADHAVAVAHASAEAATRAAEVRQTHSSFALALSDPESETEKVETLYKHLVLARTETGEKSGVPSLKDFERFVQKKTQDLKEKGGREIEYTVSIENGHVKLKARVSS